MTKKIAITISDIRLHLTQVQYGLLLRLSQSIPRVLAGAPDGVAEAESVVSATVSSPVGPKPPARVALEPELRVIPSSEARSWTTIDLLVTVNAVKLHLYDEFATTTANVKEHGIARFALNTNSLRLKMLSDGAGEAQVILKSFTMSNTRPGNSKFREIIPAAQHDRNQFMVLYTMSGGPDSSALAVMTVDSPRIIFAVDPVFALLSFFTSFNSNPSDGSDQTLSQAAIDDNKPQSSLDFRVDLHDVSISVLENDSDTDSQSIKLTIDQILLSQQVGFMSHFLLYFDAPS